MHKYLNLNEKKYIRRTKLNKNAYKNITFIFILLDFYIKLNIGLIAFDMFENKTILEINSTK